MLSIEISEPQMLVRFIDGLKIAAGSAHQLAHAQSNPMWLQVRDVLEGMIEKGQKLAIAKSAPFATVLQQLETRKLST